jgi:hypothetical protein
MKHLLYCIVEQGLVEPPTEPEMCVVAGAGLAAVARPIEESIVAPSISTLLAFAKAVEKIHAGQAVIPLRYGSTLESEAAISRLLGERRQEYEAMFDRLRGMAEMGIRVLCADGRGLGPRFPAASSLPPGGAYLAGLRNRYHSETSLAPQESQLAGRIGELLAGCFTEQRRESAQAAQGRLLSLYFLTPKTGVERFQNKARQIAAGDGIKLMLSGPWPPYNFASPGDEFSGIASMESVPYRYDNPPRSTANSYTAQAVTGALRACAIGSSSAL